MRAGLGLAVIAAAALSPLAAVSVEVLRPAIERMVAGRLGGVPLEIVAVAGPVRGWLAVAVSPPYREFPTVVLFRSQADGSWSRVFEGLTPGVQARPSKLLDLHTKGQAFDYAIGEEASRITPGAPEHRPRVEGRAVAARG